MLAMRQPQHQGSMASEYISAHVIAMFALLTAAVLAFSIPNNGNGDDASTPRHEVARSGSTLQVGAYLGGADTRGEEVKISGLLKESLTIRDLQWVGKSFKAPIYYGIRSTKWLSKVKLIGLMADFTHIKAIAPPDKMVRFEQRSGAKTSTIKAPLKERFKRLEFSHGHNLLTVNGVFALPLFNGWLKPYIGLGAGVAVPHVEVRRRGDARERWTYEYQVTGPALQALVGLEIRLTERISVFFEYKLNYANIDVSLNKGGRLRTQLFTHQGLSGLTTTVL